MPKVSWLQNLGDLSMEATLCLVLRIQLLSISQRVQYASRLQLHYPSEFQPGRLGSYGLYPKQRHARSSEAIQQLRLQTAFEGHLFKHHLLGHQHRPCERHLPTADRRAGRLG